MTLHELTDDLTTLVNTAFNAGMTPKDILDGLGGEIAATARALGAEDEDVFHLFTSFAYGFRPQPEVRPPIPKVDRQDAVMRTEAHCA